MCINTISAFLVAVAMVHVSFEAPVADVADASLDGGIEISASLTCRNQKPAILFKIMNNWNEGVKITKNWLPWNRSPWFEIYINALNKRARPSLSRYREDRSVALLPGEEINGAIEVDRLFPGVEMSESLSIRWKMVGAPFRSFFSGPQEGEVEFTANHCDEFVK